MKLFSKSEKKIRTIVIDRDLSCREDKKFPISQDGSKIRIKSGGKGNFNPLFDPDCVLELPKRFGSEKVVFVINHAKSCFKFRRAPTEISEKIQTEEDLKELLDAASGEDPDPEAVYLLNLVLVAIQDSGQADYLKPDPETVIELAENKIAKGMGENPNPPIPWQIWGIFGMTLLILLLTLGVL